MNLINRKNILTVLIAGMVFGCTGQRLKRPEINIPDKFRGQDTISNLDTTGIAAIPYHEFFQDSLLLELIDKGVANNNNLLTTIKQIEFASQSLKQAKLGNVPSLNFSAANVSINRPSDNSLNGAFMTPIVGKSYIEDYGSTLNLSWEADIWGKIRGRKEAALAAYLETQEAAKAVKTKLVSDIAQGYYNLLMLDVQLDITKKNIALLDTTINMTRVQRDMGMATTLALQQQEAAREQIIAGIPAIEQAIKVQENALSILTGFMPAAIRRAATFEILVSEKLPTALPANMLSARPDLRQSEFQFRQAVAMEHVAKASLYPSLNITAQGGLNALKASDWFSFPGSLFGIATGSITQPLLNGRGLKTQFKQSQIAVEQAELRFKEAVLNAVGEVSNSLTEIEALKRQEQSTIKQVDTLRGAVNNAILLFNNDMANYLEVLAAQNSKLQAELSLAEIKRKRLNAAVNLYRAVGGGWK